MSKLIVEMEYPKNGCSECRLKYKKRGYGGVFYCFNHLCVDKWTYSRTQNGDRPSWCPIKGEISGIELMHLEEERAFAARNIAAERKDDGTTVD